MMNDYNLDTSCIVSCFYTNFAHEIKIGKIYLLCEILDSAMHVFLRSQEMCSFYQPTCIIYLGLRLGSMSTWHVLVR